MSKYVFVCAFLALACIAHAGVWISATFKNAHPTDKVELFVPHYYVDGRSDTYPAVFDPQKNAFIIKGETPEAQLAFLVREDDRLPVFIEPEDSLRVESDAYQFPLTVAFSGRGGYNNRVLKQYLSENKADFNEFNNIRFKIGQYWTSVEGEENENMLAMPPQTYRAVCDQRRTAATALLDQFDTEAPGAITPLFREWLSTETLYAWGYRLLVYGQVYQGRHSVMPEFFDFMYETPSSNEMVGSESYRLFLLALMARQQAKSKAPEPYYAGQYQLAEQMLSGKAMAYFRSELIRMAFSAERHREILPFYSHFLQENPYDAYETKAVSLYEKTIRISPGAAAPDFQATDANGAPVSLSQMRGKVVYLDFWATWCAPCLKKMDLFETYAAELKEAGVQIIHISVDQQEERWRETLRERPTQGAHVLADAGVNGRLARLFDVEALPQYFIIDKNGVFSDRPLSHQPEDIKNRLLALTKL